MAPDYSILLQHLVTSEMVVAAERDWHREQPKQHGSVSLHHHILLTTQDKNDNDNDNGSNSYSAFLAKRREVHATQVNSRRSLRTVLPGMACMRHELSLPVSTA